jgi:hypothetical protein
MKRNFAFALLSIAALIAVPSIKAQQQLTSNVPFAFTVAGKALPAGEYTISSPGHGVVRLVSAQNNVVATVTVAKCYDDANGKNVLVFAKYGNRYFLRQILTPTTEALRVNIPMWRLERRARSGEGILVAAR